MNDSKSSASVDWTRSAWFSEWSRLAKRSYHGIKYEHGHNEARHVCDLDWLLEEYERNRKTKSR